MGSGLWLGNARLFGNEVSCFSHIDLIMDKFNSLQRRLTKISNFVWMCQALQNIDIDITLSHH
jgi:hypothetical protein